MLEETVLQNGGLYHIILRLRFREVSFKASW